MRLPTTFLLVVVLASASVAAEGQKAPEAPWQQFSSKEGRFSVQVPEPPSPSETKTTSFIGTITNHIFVAREPNATFTVDYSDLPHIAVAFAGSDTVYSHAKGALLKQTLSKEQSYEDIRVQGIAGKKLVYEMPPLDGHPKMHGQAYLLLKRHRLYVFDAQVPLGGSGDGEYDARRFLSSIQIGKH